MFNKQNGKRVTGKQRFGKCVTVRPIPEAFGKPVTFCVSDRNSTTELQAIIKWGNRQQDFIQTLYPLSYPPRREQDLNL